MHIVNWDQIFMEWSLGGALSEFYPMTPHAKQDFWHQLT